MTILRERRLHLTRMDRFSDLIDGLPPIANLTSKSPMTANLARDLPTVEDPIAKRCDHEILRGRSYAHCWHAGRNDEKEMWNKFAEGGRGVCIFSSTWRMLRALERHCPSHLEFKIGMCYYRDEDHPTADLWLTNALFRKQCKFKGEQEIRIVAIAKDEVVARERALGLIDLPPAEKLTVNLKALIKAVVAGPSMSYHNLAEIRRLFALCGFEPPIWKIHPFGWTNSLQGRRSLCAA